MGEQLLPCRLLVSLLLLLALMNCKNIGYASSNGTLPQEEVDAINALLQLIPQTGLIGNTVEFNNSDCGVKLNYSVSCDCNETTCRVTQLYFRNFGMIGEIPMEIGNLTSLTYLNLMYNQLSKEIPSSFQNLHKVSELYFDGNLLEGGIPTFFGGMKSLVTLSLTDNNFNSGIPSELGALPSLQELYLDYNWLSGKIPLQLGNISNLMTLVLDGNLLEGRIPTFFGGMKSLVALSLTNNNFNGGILPELGALPSLQALYLDGNWLSGKIPLQLGDISNLEILDLSNNLLFGEIPPHLGNLSNLQYMALFNNDFSGNLPQSFWKLKNMSYFNVRGNNFSGKIPDFIADWKSLYFLVLGGNNFEWPDHEVFQSLTQLLVLSIVGLTGGHGGERNFPNISASKNLTTLVLRNSSLVGPIPDSVSKIPFLTYLDLSFNNLIGEIPPFNVTYLFLRGNKLNKASRGWLSNLKDSYVDVSENLLKNLSLPAGKNVSKNWNFFSCCSGTNNTNDKWQNASYSCDSEKPMYNQLYINCGGDPTTINATRYEADLQPDGGSTFFLSPNKSWGYSSMGRNISSYIVNKTYDVNMNDATLYTTARTAPISLKYFGFCLKDGNYTVKLHFAEISWNPKNETNQEPGNVGIRIFDVEIQRIKVLANFNIVKEAGGVYKAITKDFSVSVNDNKLEIHLYWTGKGSSTSSSFPNVGPLISAISVSPESFPKVNSIAPVHGQKLSALNIAGIVASALLVPILILAFLWKLGWFGRKQLQEEELKGVELLPGTFFNFRQIQDATQNFSSTNKLGEGGFGSVYKGVLPNGTTIAVKQISAKSTQGIREFVNEVGTISALKHPNLVMLLGCCAEDNQLLLIYEYMENNSLAHALFGPEELRSRLNWPTRVKICLGIAKGLAFLHEESKLKIVHRDIKPTNILLDTDLNAKISDFGLAKLYEGEMTNVTTRIAGTTGYMAPEYAMRGHLTSKADVYSFGVVTLEIVSGKNSASYRPNDENVYLLDLAYVLQQKGNIIKLVDPTLGSNYSSEQAVTILELAMLCTNQSPSLRPAMSEVVKILEGKSKIVATPVSGPYSMDDSMMGLLYSTSQEGTSNANSSQAVSKEVEEWPLLDDWRTAKSMPDFSRSTKFYSTSQEGTSNANRSQAISKKFAKSETFF